MSIQFSADEVLAVAEQIERNGARFYDAAATRVSDGPSQRLLVDLAERERVHEKTFAGMRASLSGRAKEHPTYDPAGEVADYLKAWADANVIRPSSDPVALLGARPAYRDILSTAIAMEKDSVVFYVGMKDMVPARAGTEQVDEILREEMRHLATLNQALAQLRS